MTRYFVGLIGAVLLLAGCAETARPNSAADPSSVEGGGFTNQTLELSGVILVRPASTAGTQYTGDNPFFGLVLPENVTRVHAVATWDPPQQMGLEFDAPDDSVRYTSWDQNDPTNWTQMEPPIEMTLENPMPGRWLGYIGPLVAGGAVSWKVTMNVTLPNGSTAETTSIE